METIMTDKHDNNNISIRGKTMKLNNPIDQNPQNWSSGWLPLSPCSVCLSLSLSLSLSASVSVSLRLFLKVKFEQTFVYL